jgi:hypothetical protein
MPKGDDIQERLLSLAVSVTMICRENEIREAHFANQLLRSGTSPSRAIV